MKNIIDAILSINPMKDFPTFICCFILVAIFVYGITNILPKLLVPIYVGFLKLLLFIIEKFLDKINPDNNYNLYRKYIRMIQNPKFINILGYLTYKAVSSTDIRSLENNEYNCRILLSRNPSASCVEDTDFIITIKFLENTSITKESARQIIFKDVRSNRVIFNLIKGDKSEQKIIGKQNFETLKQIISEETLFNMKRLIKFINMDRVSTKLYWYNNEENPDELDKDIFDSTKSIDVTNSRAKG